MSRCKRCGGSLVVDDGEVKCLACGQAVCVSSGAISAQEALLEVERDREVDWAEYVAGRRETASARYGKADAESIAEYKRVYWVSHREKCMRDMLRWQAENVARLKEYRRRYRMFTDFGVCLACGKPIHFSQKSGWTHYRKDRSFHKAEFRVMDEG